MNAAGSGNSVVLKVYPPQLVQPSPEFSVCLPQHTTHPEDTFDVTSGTEVSVKRHH
jgi:hypothetical protein